MPSYRYKCKSGHTQVDFQQNYKNRKKHMKCKSCGKRAFWSYSANTQSSSAWPHASDAMSVAPNQIAEAAKHDSDGGVPTNYTKDGSPIYESRGHRKKHMELNGYIDRDGGCGDNTKTYARGDRE